MAEIYAEIVKGKNEEKVIEVTLKTADEAKEYMANMCNYIEDAKNLGVVLPFDGLRSVEC